MFQRLGIFAVVLAVVASASATVTPGSISGYVRNAAGVPQMGAVVEILSTSAKPHKVFTDERGFYSAVGLLPGIYSVKASAPSFLPSLRDKLGLHSGSVLVVNLTLNTLFEALDMVPLRGASDDDDWKWTLRSVANRPVLRVLEDGTSVVAASEGGHDHDVKAHLSFLAGSPSMGYGSASDMSTGFSVERSIFATGRLALGGNVGYGTNNPDAVLRTSYSHRLDNGSVPQISFTMRRLAAPDPSLHTAGLQALALTTSDNLTLGNVLELEFGSEMQTIQFMGRLNAARPFGSADLHLSPNTVVEYRYASSVPNNRSEKGFDSSPADFSESGPRVSMAEFTPALERAHHHEISVSQRVGDTSIQAAVYSDQVADPALTGVGTISTEGGEVLPDIYSGTFTYQGRDLNTNGLRVALQRKLSSDLLATLDYGYGGVLDLGRTDVELQNARQWLRVERRHALAAKLSGTVPHTKTRWIASYRWVSGQALTPVDMFNTSAGQADPYLNLFVRQPLPGTGSLPCKMEALVEVRNLLAEGYVPVMGQDGRTLFLVQSARTVRGGLAFTF